MSKQLRIPLAASAFALALLVIPDLTVSQSPGIMSQKAPELGVEQWVNLPDGKETIELADYAGKVVYLFSWQRW